MCAFCILEWDLGDFYALVSKLTCEFYMTEVASPRNAIVVDRAMDAPY